VAQIASHGGHFELREYGVKGQKWNVHNLGSDSKVSSAPGYLYHATNEERAHDIAEQGLKTHKPWEHTDQGEWPDGSREKRSYFTSKADHASSFAPEEGKSVLLRVPDSAADFHKESTGDIYSKKPIKSDKLEILGDDKQWHPISELKQSEESQTREGYRRESRRSL
jgi:hypothetical protein